MSSAEIIRAWKDPEYRSTPSDAPIHPAGVIERSDPALGATCALLEDRVLGI
jgi:mersacidin/lichenicidin family type 2 lantibiotic